jgi:hypothetical protein
MRKTDDDRRERILAKVIGDLMLNPDNPLHDNPTSLIDDEQLASEVNRTLPWLKGTRSWTEFLNEVRRVAHKNGYLKGNAQVAAYVRAGKSDPQERLETMQGGKGLAMSLAATTYPPATEEQLRAAGVFPSRVRELNIALGLNSTEPATPPMSERRRKEILAELESSRGCGGRPLL